MAATSSTPTIAWAAIAVLGAATLALGGMLLRGTTETAPTSSEPVALAPQTPVANGTVPAPLAPAGSGSAATVSNAPVAAARKPVAPSAQSQPAAPTHKPATLSPQAPTTAREAAPKVAERAAPAPACAVCGTVESVTAVQREPASGSGVGVIAGAAIGGLLGNQVGGGTGKDLATIAGMVGGGWAGNTVEKKMKRETVYEVAVRMDDGSVRKLEQKSPVVVGTKVTVNGNAVSPLTAAQ